MWSHWYHNRLKVDLEHWRAQGWVSDDGANAILADTEQPGTQGRLPGLLAILGAVLLCFAAMSFVAANWTAMPRLGRLALLLASLWGAYGAALWFRARDYSRLSDGFFLAACGMFGANIMLIAQMYHIDRHFPDGIALWAFGTLLTAAAARSAPALALAIGLGIFWSWSEMTDMRILTIHWPFLVIWTASLGVAFWLKSRLGLHLVFLGAVYWLGIGAAVLSENHTWSSTFLIGVGVAFAAALTSLGAASVHIQKPGLWRDFAPTLMCYGIIIALVAFFSLQLAHDFNSMARNLTALANKPGYYLWLGLMALFATITALTSLKARPTLTLTDSGVLLAMIAITCTVASAPTTRLMLALVAGAALLGGAIWLITLGQRLGLRLFVNLGLWAFAAEILYIYFQTFGTLLNTALFFLLGGVMLLVLGFGLERIKRSLTRPDTQSGHAS